MLEFCEKRWRERPSSIQSVREQWAVFRLRGLPEIHMPDEAVINTEGEDVTGEFLLGADAALQTAKKYGCEIAILKDRSPSCGSNGVYDGSFSHKLREGMGEDGGGVGRGMG